MRLFRSLLVAGGLLAMVPARADAQIVVNQSGVKVGFAFATLAVDHEAGEASNTVVMSRRAGFSGGLFAARNLTPRLLVQVEALISVKGTELPAGSLRLTYLEVPALVRLEPAAGSAGRNRPYLLAGPALALKLGATLSANGDSRDVGEAYDALDLGLVIAGGLDRDGFIVEARYTRGLRDVPSGQPENAGRVRNSVFTLLAGLRIPR